MYIQKKYSYTSQHLIRVGARPVKFKWNRLTFTLQGVGDWILEQKWDLIRFQQKKQLKLHIKTFFKPQCLFLCFLSIKMNYMKVKCMNSQKSKCMNYV